MKYLATALVLSCSVLQVIAQSTAPAAQTTPAWSPAQSIGMFAFPRNRQSADQQLKDEADYYGMAKQGTGIDTQAPASTGPSAEEIAAAQKQAADNAPRAQVDVFGVLRGALRAELPLERSPGMPEQERLPGRSPER